MFLALSFSAIAGSPRLIKLTYPTEDLIPIISYDVTEAPYSVDKTGKKDASEGINKALEDAKKSGGTVFLPVGKYRLNSELNIPSGVNLRGDWKKPTKEDKSVKGTILLAYAGKGQANGKALITAHEGGLRDLSIYYPEQNANSFIPYPVSVHLNGSAAMKNVTLVNSFNGVLTGGFSTIMNLYGTTLDVGVTMLNAAAVPRCRTIRLSPSYWSESGLNNSPEVNSLQATMKANKAYAIQLNRQDAGIFMDVEIDNYHTAVKLMPPHGWTYWHELKTKDIEVGIHFTGGSHQRMYVTSSQIEARQYGVLMKMEKDRWKDHWTRYSKSGKAYGSNRDIGLLRMFDCEFSGTGTNIHLDGTFINQLNLQECVFQSWGKKNTDYAIYSDAGEVDVFDSRFNQAERHLYVKRQRTKLNFVGNSFPAKPSLKLPKMKAANIDHKPAPSNGRSMPPIIPVPDMLPARSGQDSVYIIKSFNNGKDDASVAIQSALNKAGSEGGGTVYLQGSYRLTKHLTVPAGVELRGVNDFMPRGKQSRTLLVADIPADKGNPQNQPLISLKSNDELGGSGVAGLAIWYADQDYRNIQAYPWTIRSLGPGCWVQRVYLGNCYNGIDVATHDNDKHVISRVCGSALNRAFMVGNSPTIGWVDNCHIRPQDWSLGSLKAELHKNGRVKREGFVFDIPGDRYNKPTKDDIFRGKEHSLIPNLRGAGAITVGSGANVQVTAFFTNGATRAFDFIDNNGTGGGNANILIGGSEAAWGAWVKSLGKKGLNMVNFSFNPMTRLPYIEPKHIPNGHLPKGLALRIEPTVSKSTPITFISPKLYGRADVKLGIDMQGGDLYIKQGAVENDYGNAAIEVKGGKYSQRNTTLGKIVK